MREYIMKKIYYCGENFQFRLLNIVLAVAII